MKKQNQLLNVFDLARDLQVFQNAYEKEMISKEQLKEMCTSTFNGYLNFIAQ